MTTYAILNPIEMIASYPTLCPFLKNKKLINNVMLVDDDRSEHMFFTIALKDICPPVKLTSLLNGNDAIESLNVGNVLPDIIFLDLNMPSPDGFEVLSRLKAIPSIISVPIVIQTSSILQKDVIAAKAYGASYFLTKPSFDDLINILDGLINQNVSLSVTQCMSSLLIPLQSKN